MILPLVYYGDPLLRKKSEPVKEINEEVRKLVKDMEETMFANNGVGIAAPQVGVLLRVFICLIEGDDAEGYPIYGKPKVYINPVISSPDPEVEQYVDGCLSIPGIYEKIERPISIEVEAMDINGSLFKEKAAGWKARNIMHENDHLNGVLFIDRMVNRARRQAIEMQLKKIKKKYKK
ncbi:MAG: peptide deformylase [Simkaniaceae bacterium]